MLKRRTIALLLATVAFIAANWLVVSHYSATVQREQMKEAILKGNTARVRALLAAGVSPNTIFPRHIPETPLMLAAFFRRTETVELLLDRGAELERQDHYGRTALHLAAMTHPPAVVRLLIARGADVNALDNAGANPLWHARDRPAFVESDKEAVISLLRKAGATEVKPHSPVP